MPSTWVETAVSKAYPQLDKDITVDAAIIGGGMAGTTAAYLLAKAGAKVALIDKGRLADSVSAYTTAFLTYVVDTPLTELRDMFGPAAAKDVWRSGQEALNMIGQNVKAEGIDCEYMQCPLYSIANDQEEWRELSADADLAGEYGFDLRRNSGNMQLRNAGYLEVPDQAKFHPVKYLDALRAKAAASGALIFEATEAKSISEKGTPIIHTPKGRITAKHVFIATYSPFNKPKQLFAHKGTYLTYIMELKIPQGSIWEAMYEDADNPYHYLRVDRMPGNWDRVILGGEDHRHELPFNARKAYAALEAYFREVLPGVDYEVVRKWDGPILETLDGLPYIGTYDERNPDLFVATGFSGNGMTYGTLAGHMFSEFAQGRPVPYKDLYDPLRKTTPHQLWEKGRDYVEEFFRGYARNIFRSTK